MDIAELRAMREDAYHRTQTAFAAISRANRETREHEHRADRADSAEDRARHAFGLQSSP